jgi:hypothetical protein
MREAWPKAHRMAPPDRAIRQRQLCSGVRPSANLSRFARRDRNRFRSLQGRVTTAAPVPGNWTSCMAGMTRRHEGCVRTILTESGSSIPLRARPFKRLGSPKEGCKTTSTVACCVFRLDVAGGPLLWVVERACSAKHHLSQTMPMTSRRWLGSKQFVVIAAGGHGKLGTKACRFAGRDCTPYV